MSQANASFNWTPFYNMVANGGPNQLLLKTLSIMTNDVSATIPGFAVDLGCGEGRDTAELLRQGWNVLAIDNTAEGIKRLKNRTEARNSDRLETRVSELVDELWFQADLTIAWLVLPYLPPADFQQVWANIEDGLVHGGYLIVNLFGDRHEWAKHSFISTFTREEALDLFKNYTLNKFEEIETQATAADGSTITTHEYRVIARRL